jgi:hypothetical protein
MQTEHSSKLRFIVVEATQPCSVIPTVRGMEWNRHDLGPVWHSF